MKPILFNTEMVKAILEERKTQTRRTVKEEIPHTMKLLQKGRDEENKTHYLVIGAGGGILKTIYPKYQVGDTLYVREAWQKEIFLKVTDVRIERLQDISEDDAKAEGSNPEFEMNLEDFMNKKTNFKQASTYYLGFKHLWKSLKQKEGFTWDDNPFVWVYQFKQTEKPEQL